MAVSYMPNIIFYNNKFHFYFYEHHYPFSLVNWESSGFSLLTMREREREGEYQIKLK